jgi:hypothetical protein
VEKNWYYVVDGARQGPVAFDELQTRVASGEVKPLDLVWQPAFGPEWRQAGQVAEFFAPPLPSPETAAARDDAPLTGVAGMRPSCLAAVAQAFAHMVTLLFRPFDLARWFSIGFCAWMAYIGTSSYRFKSREAATPEMVKQRFDQMLDTVFASPPEITEVAVVSGAVVLGLLLGLLFCRLRSRGDFMFLHRWYRPDAPISQCWWSARAAGRELFAWRVYFFLIAMLLFALVAIAAYATVLKPYMAAGKVWDAALLQPVALCATAAGLLTVAVQVIAHLAKAFVVPVMYWQGVTAARAWLAVFALCNQYPFAVLSYLLCGVGCAVAAGFAILAFGLLTCCLGFIPMALPYVGAVVLLPGTLFFRGYAVCFLSQWRPELVPASV